MERGALVAAGAVVSPGTVVPSGELWGGAPAKKLRALKPEERRYLEALPPKCVRPGGGCCDHQQQSALPVVSVVTSVCSVRPVG